VGSSRLDCCECRWSQFDASPASPLHIPVRPIEAERTILGGNWPLDDLELGEICHSRRRIHCFMMCGAQVSGTKEWPIVIETTQTHKSL
jgi:hypothetical protein